MNWILLAVIAQFLNAIVAIIDKRIVSDEKILPKPFVYAFYSCLLSGVWILIYFLSFIPLPLEGLHLPAFENISKPSLTVVALAFLAAYTFFTALVSMFTAFQQADASDVVPVVGATSAVGAYLLSHIFLDVTITPNFTLGIILLSVGTFLVSRFHFSLNTAFVAIHAGLFFAFHYIALKGLFSLTTFDDGFFWSRIAFMLYALSLLLVPAFYEKINEQTKVTTRKAGFLVFVNKIIAGVVTLLILKATALGDVAVVQALGGLQFLFVLLIGIFFTFRSDALGVGEKYKRESILQKALFVAIISIGFLVLFK